MSRSIQINIKRIFDIVACCVILILGFPIIIVLSLLVKLSSPGPILFIQERIGKDGIPFFIYKFRTMTGLPEKGATRWLKSDEDRITSIGAFLRDYGLDELPQVINILKGDMSIVGPRTPLPQQIEFLSPRFKKMFIMRPGVLSLAAIKGRRSLSMEQRYELHVQYVETWSLKLDSMILWKSLFVILRREDAREKFSGE